MECNDGVNMSDEDDDDESDYVLESTRSQSRGSLGASDNIESLGHSAMSTLPVIDDVSPMKSQDASAILREMVQEASRKRTVCVYIIIYNL